MNAHSFAESFIQLENVLYCIKTAEVQRFLSSLKLETLHDLTEIRSLCIVIQILSEISTLSELLSCLHVNDKRRHSAIV